MLHRKTYIADAKREISHRDLLLACRLMYLTAFLALTVCVSVKLLIIL